MIQNIHSPPHTVKREISKPATYIAVLESKEQAKLEGYTVASIIEYSKINNQYHEEEEQATLNAYVDTSTTECINISDDTRHVYNDITSEFEQICYGEAGVSVQNKYGGFCQSNYKFRYTPSADKLQEVTNAILACTGSGNICRATNKTLCRLANCSEGSVVTVIWLLASEGILICERTKFRVHGAKNKFYCKTEIKWQPNWRKKLKLLGINIEKTRLAQFMLGIQKRFPHVQINPLRTKEHKDKLLKTVHKFTKIIKPELTYLLTQCHKRMLPTKLLYKLRRLITVAMRKMPKQVWRKHYYEIYTILNLSRCIVTRDYATQSR